MTEDESIEPDGEPSGRVTNRDLLRLTNAVHAGQDTLLRCMNDGFTDLRANMLELRGVVNEQLHKQDKKIQEIADDVKPMKQGWDIRVALLRGSWKLTGTMIVASSIISGLIVRFGFPWDWCR